ncbi:MAG: glycosyltransferase [Muribaculum sp.]
MTRYITPDNWLALSLACASLVLALTAVMVYRRRIISVPRCVKRQAAEGLPDDTACPPVSVIVYSFNNPEGLQELIPQLRRQDYPGKFDIIVVNDGKDDATERLLNRMSAEEGPRLYHTFTPRDTRNLSRKKLALTLGIKAAAGDCIVNVTSDTRVMSDNWLRLMAAPFADPGTEIAIGYAAPDSAADTARGARGRRHDRLMDSVYYLASALAGKTYRGDGDNLAYRRDTFFRMKGFSNSLNLHYGDDDLFVCEASSADNTAVVLAPDAQVISTFSSDRPEKIYRYKKLRYDFTSRFAGRGQHIFYGTLSLLLWIWLGLTAAAVAIEPLNPVSLAICAVSTLSLWLPLMTAWNSAAGSLGSKRFLLSVPFFLMWRPLRNIVYRLRSRKIHDAQYAWQSQSMA